MINFQNDFCKMNNFIKQANEWGSKKIPFFFLIDFEKKRPVIFKLEDLKYKNVLINFPCFSNFTQKISSTPVVLDFNMMDKETYKKAFEKVLFHIKQGDSYLLNLTFPALITSNINLKEIFLQACSKYKIYFKEQFVGFSPETFIKINDNTIYSYPMKGTIDASLPNAKELLLSNKKELYEHYTIVDLIRNDLSKVANKVTVTKFRLVDKIVSAQGKLLQVSSEIQGKLDINWQRNIGNILDVLLPAGSISGAPKDKTIEIIRKNELDERGYYTGIYGVFDGQNLDSAVNIRFIEKNKNRYFYRSGGGLTALSELNNEYKELKQKIYVPIDGNY